MINTGIYASLLLSLLLGTLYRPAIGLAALACIQVLDFWGQLASPWLAENGKFTNLYVVGLIAIGLLRAQQRSSEKTHGIPWVQVLVICLWIEAGISLYWSPAFKQGVGEWSKYWPYMMLHASLVPLLFRRPIDLQHGLSAVLVLGAILAVLVDAFVRWDQRFIVSFYNPNEKFWNALAFAQLAGYVTIAAVLLNHRKSWFWRLLKIVAIVSSVILVVKSGTRGQFVLMAALPIAFLPMSRPLGSMKAYVSGLLLVVCLASASIFAYDSFTHQDERWSSGRFESDWELRVMMADKLVNHWLKASNGDPTVLLLGLGNSASFSQRINGFYPHIVVPEILGEEGLLGLGLFCSAVWMSIYITRSAYRLSIEDPVQRGILATLAASFTFAFILSFKQGSLVGYSAELFSFAILIERQTRLLVAAKRVHVEKETIRRPQSKPVIVSKAPPDGLPNLLSTPGVPRFGQAK
jgi:hypothetical protein